MGSHYNYLDKHFHKFAKEVGADIDWADGMVVAHGDKGYSYEGEWEENGISFNHGMMIFLLSYLKPFSKTVRETEKGWVAPCQWVIDNYKNFEKYLPKEE